MENTKYFGRIDSEFFLKKYLILSKKVESRNSDNLSKHAYITDGEHGNPKTLPLGYAKYYGARNVLNGILSDNDIEYITKEHHEKLKKSQLKPNDILISCVGANIGYAAIVPNSVGEANIVRNVALLKTKSKQIKNQYLLSYFLGKYGKRLYIRMASGNSQPLVSLEYIKTIPLFIPGDFFQFRIEQIVENAKRKLFESIETYKKAETLLIDSLDLKDFKPSKGKVNVKSLKDSFLSSGRLDAEYYQVKYEDYINLISNYYNGWQALKDVCNLKDKNFKPEDAKGYKYIELSNIGKSGEITGCTNSRGESLPSRAKRKVNTGDVIVSSIEGSLESCAIITEAYNKSICSTGFYVANSALINSETLLVLFKSEPMQNILKKNCSGTILTAINKDEFLNIPIPLIENKTQEQISELVQESFRLKAQSEHLLEVAKRAVEVAIEDGEDKGAEFIAKNKIDE